MNADRRQNPGDKPVAACRVPSCYQGNSTAGTIFDKTTTLLTIWFEAAWHLTTAKHGLSARTLERMFGVRYRVAWTMLQCFRIAMVRTDRSRHSGTVEVDETMVGGVKRGGKRGRGTAKSVVVIAVEVLDPKGFGRARIRHVPDASGAILLPFVQYAVTPGAIIHTDGLRGYNGLGATGYTHLKTVLATSDDPAHVAMTAVHRLASLLKRWILGTHQGSVAPENLQAYLEEFPFRFNRRTSRNRGLLFHPLLEQVVVTPPMTESHLSHGKHWRPQ